MRVVKNAGALLELAPAASVPGIGAQHIFVGLMSSIDEAPVISIASASSARTFSTYSLTPSAPPP
jgi:hypothetical protein